jgi:DNA polymerase-3 subunit epsilon
MRQIILDTETTGLSYQGGHRIIEIGCVELIDRQMTDNHFQHYINPQREIDSAATRVHGINTSMLVNKPLFADIAEEFIAYIEGAEVVIHNAPFDVGFLENEFKKADKKYKKIDKYCSITCSLEMARRLHPGQRNSLDALCKRYHVNNSLREFHGALLDAKILAEVYLAMTGGQESLFGSGSLKEKTIVDKQKSFAKNNVTEHRQSVIDPNQDELKEHQEYLEFLQKQSEKVEAWD